MNNKGFTLVEVIIAMAFTGIIAVTFIPLLTAQYINIQKTGDKSDATYNAVEKAEDAVVKVNNKEPNTDPNVELIEAKDPLADEVIINLDPTPANPTGVVEMKVNTITVKGKDGRKGMEDMEDQRLESELIIGVPKVD